MDFLHSSAERGSQHSGALNYGRLGEASSGRGRRGLLLRSARQAASYAPEAARPV